MCIFIIIIIILVGYIETSVRVSIYQHSIFFGRFMDDILTIVRNKAALDFLKCELSGVHKNIHFTSEFVSENKLPFLDVLLQRNDSILSFG